MTDFPRPIAPADKNSQTFAVLVWIGTIFFSFIPALIVYLLKKDDAFLQEHAKEALNWAITMLLLTLIGQVLAIVLIGFLLMGIMFIAQLIFCIIGAVKASNGQPCTLPFNIRLIK
ncbi:hypothetical protein JHS3_19560 [Jeongeupia sp. HS-3]|uniref:DUF4870 domain-containing protein n=1 Tax=Jeongeupia sp. HS-3 TaxID=1009682 RepID=UPI0018A6412F|nr:DUF4870 domain-containing protein [Jeongeupia sp. HS-3]BCL76220.1 hypothetical protein JHS3_19560 [Jeongeupia sp. HS-3]